ncbi:hypothetical protein ACGVWS_13675 [Enterobacteriaceae bacterium LUAb1]
MLLKSHKITTELLMQHNGKKWQPTDKPAVNIFTEQRTTPAVCWNPSPGYSAQRSAEPASWPLSVNQPLQNTLPPGQVTSAFNHAENSPFRSLQSPCYPDNATEDDTLEKLARAALTYSRRCYALKPPNKRYNNKVVAALFSSNDHTCDADTQRLDTYLYYTASGHFDVPGKPDLITFIHDEFRKGNTRFSGTCDQLARSAFFFMVSQGRTFLHNNRQAEVMRFIVAPNPFGHTWVIVRYKDMPSDHNICALLAGSQTNHHLGQKAIVCDPWANICCPLSFFLQAWKNKMHKWESRTKEIRVNAEWKSPIDNNILNYLSTHPWQIAQYALI